MNLKVKANLSKIKWLVTLYSVLSTAYFHINKDDIWIGLFIDRKKGVFYITYLPCLVIRFIYDEQKWQRVLKTILCEISIKADGVASAMAKFAESVNGLGVALSGMVKDFEVDSNGHKIIKDAKITGVSFVSKENLVDPNCVIKNVDNEVIKEIKS